MLPAGNAEAQAGHDRENGKVDLFLYKGRECKSAPAGTLTRSDSIYSQSSYTSSKYSSEEKGKRVKKGCCCRRCSFTCKTFFNFFFGHAPEFTTWATSFNSTSRLKYLSLFFVESSLRSIGDVTFCNNPFSGLLIFIAMIISRPQVAFLAFITLVFGMETAVIILRIPMEEVRSGGVLFNNFLAGTVIALLAHDDDLVLRSPQIILICMVIGILTVFVWQGLNGVVASHFEFPLLNAPFHVILLLYIFSGLAAKYDLGEVTIQAPPEGLQDLSTSVKNATLTALAGKSLDNGVDVALASHINGTSAMYHFETPNNLSSAMLPPPIITKNKSGNMVESLDWEKVFCGMVLAPSQVFGTKDLMTTLLIHISLLLYSPIMLAQSLTGAFIGTMIGIFFGNTPEVYNGAISYNSFFTSSALGGFFLVFNLHSWLLSIVGSILTALLYSAMVKCGLPALGIPFMLTTWLLLPGIGIFQEQETTSSKLNDNDVESESMQTGMSKLTGPFIRLRLAEITTPELNRQKWLTQKQSSGNNNNNNGKSAYYDKQNGVAGKYGEFQANNQPSPAMMQQNSILPL